MTRFFSFLFFFLFLISCRDQVSVVPKPRAYPRIIFPERTYIAFNQSYCDFSFDFPNYCEVEREDRFFDEAPQDSCWFDLYFAPFNARLHCSYVPIDKENSFARLRDDAFKLVNKHTSKASYIEEVPIVGNNNGVTGFVFDIQGPAASPYQFYLTDSTNHFIRASLYFRNQVNVDSIAPVLDFIRTDVNHMIRTFSWNKK